MSKRWRCPWGGCTAVIPSFDLVGNPWDNKEMELAQRAAPGPPPRGPGDLFQTIQPHLKTTHWTALVVMKSLEILSTLSGSHFPFPASPPPEVIGISRLPPVGQQHSSDTTGSNKWVGEQECYLLLISLIWMTLQSLGTHLATTCLWRAGKCKDSDPETPGALVRSHF